MLVSRYTSLVPSLDARESNVGRTSAIATEVASDPREDDTIVTYWERVWDTRDRAFSGSSGSVLVVNVIRRGRRARAMLWSAGEGCCWRRRERMQFAAILAVLGKFS